MRLKNNPSNLISILIIYVVVVVESIPWRNKFTTEKGIDRKRTEKPTTASPKEVQERMTKEEENSLNRLRELSSDGRLILLVCKVKCSKQRIEISKWLYDFNVDYNTSAKQDVINYHYHHYVNPLTWYNIENALKSRQFLVLYVVGSNGFHFKNETISKAAFWKWLTLLEHFEQSHNFKRISNPSELNNLLNNVSYECDIKNLPIDYIEIKNNYENQRHLINNTDEHYEYILEPSTVWEKRRLFKLTNNNKLHIEYKQSTDNNRTENSKTSFKNRRKNYNNYNEKYLITTPLPAAQSTIPIYSNVVDPTRPLNLRIRNRRNKLSSNNPHANVIVKLPYKENFKRHQKLLLIVHDPDFCPVKNLGNFVRTLQAGFATKNITIAEVRRPLSVEEDVILRQRLIGVNYKCTIIVLMNNNEFIQLPNGITVVELYNLTRIWEGGNEDTCTSVSLDYAHRIGPALNDVEMIYFKEQVLIQRIEFSQAFVIVGVVGGLAVVALAISIFWGLNGTSFIAK